MTVVPLLHHPRLRAPDWGAFVALCAPRDCYPRHLLASAFVQLPIPTLSLQLPLLLFKLTAAFSSQLCRAHITYIDFPLPINPILLISTPGEPWGGYHTSLPASHRPLHAQWLPRGPRLIPSIQS